MTEAQKRLRELTDRQSKDRQRAIELSKAEELTEETRAELDAIETRAADTERQLRAARLAVDADEQAEAREAEASPEADPETRERLELRGKASLGNYLVAALRGRAPIGAEAELQQAAGVDGIPLELWDVPETRAVEGTEDRVTPAPSTVGVNLDPLRPMVFAPSVVDKLQVDMPMVSSGTYATGTLTTAAEADAVAKEANVPERDGAFTVQTTTPHRVGGSLNLAVEDIAAVGQANFEGLLRQHVSLVLSDELDDQMLNGAGTNDDLLGFFNRLNDPSAPTAVATFDLFLKEFADGVDGLWASTVSEVAIVAGVDTYRLSARTFRDASGQDLGDISFADYAASKTAGWWTNSRMPAKASEVQQAILCRKGRTMMPSPVRLAVCPHWGYLSVDDIYTGARAGTRRFVLSVLVGDVILVQPDAFQQVAFKVA